MEDYQSQPDRRGDRLTRIGGVLALISAIAGFLLIGPASIVFWLPSFVAGMLVLRSIRRNGRPRKGLLTAWMAVLISGAGIVLFAWVSIPVLLTGGIRDGPIPVSCENNLHQLALAINSYTGDHKDRYPDPDNWPQQIIGYLKTRGVFICPVRTNRGLKKYPVKLGDMESLSVTFAMNARLKGLSVRDVKKPEETVLLFESNGEKLSGGPELLPKEMRHEEEKYLVFGHPYINVLFADGHVRKIPVADVPHLKWDPK